MDMKIVYMLAIFTLPLASIAASAGFISSELDLSVEKPSAVPLNEAIVLHARLNFSWGFGAIIPMPLVIYIEAENVPDWLSVSIQPSSFTITPVGWRGGSVEKDVTITLRAKDEAPAFITYNVVIHAFTNGSLLVNGAEDKEALDVMQDFHDAGIFVEYKSVKLSMDESKEVTINVTNNCNSPLYINVQPVNESKYFDFSFPSMQIIQSHSTGVIKIGITAKKIGKEDVPLKIEYYPPGHEEKKNFAYTNITIESYGKEGSITAISIGIIIVIIVASIIIVIWKRR